MSSESQSPNELRTALQMRLMRKCGEMNVAYPTIREMVIQSLGYEKPVASLDALELKKVLRDITGEDVTV